MKKNSVAARMRLLARLTNQKLNNKHITKYVFGEDKIPGSSWENYQPPVKRKMFEEDDSPQNFPYQVQEVNLPGRGPTLIHNHNPNIKNPTLVFSDPPFYRERIDYDPEELVGSLAWLGERLVYVSGFNYIEDKLVISTRPDKKMSVSPYSIMPFKENDLVRIIHEEGESRGSTIARVTTSKNSSYQVNDSSQRDKRYPIHLLRKMMY